eukprot:11354760-Alexandrium_andersonii.AAC.1
MAAAAASGGGGGGTSCSWAGGTTGAKDLQTPRSFSSCAFAGAPRRPSKVSKWNCPALGKKLHRMAVTFSAALAQMTTKLPGGT